VMATSAEERHVFQFTLLSSAGRRHYPDNSLSRFTNDLQRPLYPSNASNKLFVRLRSLTMMYKLQEEDPLATYVSVHLSELEPSIFADSKDRGLGSVTFHPSGDPEEFYSTYDFQHTPYIALRTIPLHTLTVTLTNSANQQLKLIDVGPPTLIQLEIADMDLSHQFTMTCMSHRWSDLKLYPTNQISDFRMKTPQSLMLSGWETALLSVAYPPHLKPVFLVNFQIKYGPDITDSLDFVYNLFDYKGDEDLLFKAVQAELSEHDETRDTVVLERDTKTMYKDMWLFKIKTTDPVMTFFPSPDFWHMFDSSHRYAGAIDLKQTPMRFGTCNMTSMLPPTVGLLFSDIVRASAVGEEMKQLLHIIPINHLRRNLTAVTDQESTSALQNVVYEPQHLVFHDVVDTEINSIRFWTQQPDGDAHVFKMPEGAHGGGLVINLLFRPKKTKSIHYHEGHNQ
jgi:hypothetical protein